MAFRDNFADIDYRELLVDTDNNSTPVLERELTGQFQRSQGQEIPENDGNSSQVGSQLTDEKQSLQGGLGERVTARTGFNAPRLNTENIRSADSLPGLSPATLLESPVFLFDPLFQRSPTNGTFPFLPSDYGDIPSTSPPSPPDKSPEASFEDINGSFSFPALSKPTSSFFSCETSSRVDAAHQSYPSFGAVKNETVESDKPISENNESSDLEAEFLGSSAEKDNGTNSDAAGERLKLILTLDDQQAEKLIREGWDGYNWRKYGEKYVKGSGSPRSYFKCTHSHCKVRKKVERSTEGHIKEIIYVGDHNHSNPCCLPGSSNPTAENRGDNSEQTEPQIRMGKDSVKGNPSGDSQIQTGKGSESGEVVDGSLEIARKEDEDDHGSHGSVSLGDHGEGDESESKRRKHEVYATEMSGTTRGIRKARVMVQTISAVDILDDGYRWRKYGQKVVKGNPNARSYYKCTTPGCEVRKHVERAPKDPKAVLTTYEGKHNHHVPPPRNSSHGGSGGSGGSGGPAAQTGSKEPEPRHRSPTPGSASLDPFNLPQQQLVGPSSSGFSSGTNQLGSANIGLPGFGLQPGDLPDFGFQPGHLPQFGLQPGDLPDFGFQPADLPVFSGNLPVFHGNLPDYPGNQPVYPGNLPDYPRNQPVYPGNPSYFWSRIPGSDIGSLLPKEEPLPLPFPFPFPEPGTGLSNSSGSYMNQHIRPPWRR